MIGHLCHLFLFFLQFLQITLVEYTPHLGQRVASLPRMVILRGGTGIPHEKAEGDEKED